MLVTEELVVRMAAEPIEATASYQMPDRIATPEEVERALRRHGIPVTGAPADRFEAGRRLDQFAQARAVASIGRSSDCLLGKAPRP
jgi:hypothetical protein